MDDYLQTNDPGLGNDWFGEQDSKRVARVRQTAFCDEGNCLRACIATICQVELDQVVDVLDGARPEADWFLRIEEWAKDRGYELDVHAPFNPPSGWSMAIGETVRGPQTHAVVAYGGVLWWDPHPSDLWIKDVDYYVSWTKVDG